jgi:uncharacterized protein (DUF2141 family)
MKTKMKSWVLAIGLAYTAAFSQNHQRHTLTVYAENFKNNTGQSVANLFVKGESLKQKPAHQLISKILNGKAVFEFKDLAYGEYAVILWHDKNANADLDHSFGMPSEPLGYSNGWNFSLFSGMPSFEKLKFSFSDQTDSITIKLK